MLRVLVLISALFLLCPGCAEEPARRRTCPQAAGPVGQVNELYVQSVRPIMESKCLDCHSGPTHYPWYHVIPGVKQIIDRDIIAARRDVDMSCDFPFLGNATPLEFLGAMRDVMEDGSMPPWRYRVMHPNSALSVEDENRILRWIDRGEEILKAAPPNDR